MRRASCLVAFGVLAWLGCGESRTDFERKGGGGSSGSVATGGSATGGTAAGSSGASSSGASTGGASTGGASTGGASTGGEPTGGTSTGGTSTGGSPMGGSGMGGSMSGAAGGTAAGAGSGGAAGAGGGPAACYPESDAMDMCGRLGASCLCCPIGGPQQSCICTTQCTTSADCHDAARPVCNIDTNFSERGICAPDGFICRWGSR